MPDMQTFNEIIDAFPSAKDLASDLGEKPTLIAVWKHRDSIPVARWLEVVAAADRRGIRGVTLEALARIAARHGAHAQSGSLAERAA
jgi:hypothetical protein